MIDNQNIPLIEIEREYVERRIGCVRKLMFDFRDDVRQHLYDWPECTENTPSPLDGFNWDVEHKFRDELIFVGDMLILCVNDYMVHLKSIKKLHEIRQRWRAAQSALDKFLNMKKVRPDTYITNPIKSELMFNFKRKDGDENIKEESERIK